MKPQPFTHYETTFIVSSQTPTESLDAIIEKVKKIISKSSVQGEQVLIENEGLKKLAYPIKGNQEGYYIYCEYKGADGVSPVAEVESFLRLNDSVIRYLSVVKTKPSKVKPRKPRTTSVSSKEKKSDVSPLDGEIKSGNSATENEKPAPSAAV